MPDILKVTSPPVTHESVRIPKSVPSSDTNISPVSGTSRGTKANPQNISGAHDNSELFRGFESNFDKFLQMLHSIPDTGELYKEIFFIRTGFLINEGIDESFTKEILEFTELLKMTDEELLVFLKSQFNASTKFGGQVFDIFREIYSDTKSDSLKMAILDTLRKYDGMTSKGHILNEIVSNLKSIAKHLPDVSAQDLIEMSGRLLTEGTSGNVSENLNILKSEIIPFLSKYIKVTHDFGTVRDLITMLTFNTARYEYCSKESFLQSFNALLAFEEVSSKFTTEEFKNLEKLWTAEEIHSAKNSNKLIDKFISVIAKGMESKTPQNQAVFKDIIQSALTNESVYMPLSHIVIPADINGQMIFSEIWVDTDAENSETGANSGEKAVKLFIKLDIKNTGHFEIIILAKKTELNLHVFYPEKLAPIEDNIKEGVREIADRNMLLLNSFVLEKLMEPKPVSEVFSKIYERRNDINVIV